MRFDRTCPPLSLNALNEPFWPFFSLISLILLGCWLALCLLELNLKLARFFFLFFDCSTYLWMDASDFKTALAHFRELLNNTIRCTHSLLDCLGDFFIHTLLVDLMGIVEMIEDVDDQSALDTRYFPRSSKSCPPLSNQAISTFLKASLSLSYFWCILQHWSIHLQSGRIKSRWSWTWVLV